MRFLKLLALARTIASVGEVRPLFLVGKVAGIEGIHRSSTYLTQAMQTHCPCVQTRSSSCSYKLLGCVVPSMA